MVARVLKRILDVVIASLGLIVLFPIMVAIALAVLLVMGRPVLFRQLRVGYKEKPFILLKFRTMREAYDAEGNPLPDADRVTLLGEFLRKTSLDELPQLWNVLRGDMSLVGPRPLFVEYLPYYTERERIRHKVRPGITGLAQVTGRTSLPWDERLNLDVWYVENWSLYLDFKIIMKTIIKVISCKDVLERAPEGSLIEHRRRQMMIER